MNAKQPTVADPAAAEPTANERAADEQVIASAVFETMRRLVLEQEDRRAEVAEALGVSFSRSRALRRLAAGPQRFRTPDQHRG